MLYSPAVLTRISSPNEWARHPRRRRNLLRQTSNFNDAIWSGYWVKPTLTTGHLAPDGTNTAWAWFPDTTSGSPTLDRGGVFQTIGGAIGQVYTASIWLRASAGITVNFGVDDGGSTGPVSVTTAWQRFVRTGPTATGTGARGLQLFDIDQSPGVQLFLWGPQCELGGNATAYQRID